MPERTVFLSPQASMERLRPILQKLADVKAINATPLHPVVLLLLKAHEAIVQSWEESGMSCEIPWDDATSLPSHPTLAADAQSWGKRTSGKEQALLASFKDWSVWEREKIKCSCRDRSFRSVDAEILLRHDLGKTGPSLIVRQTTAVWSRDKKFLHGHFGGYIQKAADDTVVVAVCEGRLRVSEGVELAIAKDEGVALFNRHGLCLSIREAVQV